MSLRFFIAPTSVFLPRRIIEVYFASKITKIDFFFEDVAKNSYLCALFSNLQSISSYLLKLFLMIAELRKCK